ncbi:ABC transporter permease [Shewanella sp.]|uniref:ABC transporter permease n=1 Tax=Shewanella sp. TaxID=50422 RepID=UPI001ECA58CD|nr:ABC transporter permease [Shewanella sp.]NRB25747.1 FtsX-like permease family protein [Shewanella sp.]
MLINYVITAYRSFQRQKTYFAINVIGLAVGLAAALLVALYAYYESSFDEFHPHTENTYRILQHYKSVDISVPIISPSIGQYATKLDGVEAVFSWVMGGEKIDDKVKVNDQYLPLENVYAATPNLTDFFSINVLDGQLKEALTLPDRIALSHSAAVRFFGSTSVVGRRLETASKIWTVGAIFEDMPTNTHLLVDAIISESQFNHRFFRNDSFTYIRLSDNANKASILSKISKFVNAHQGKNNIEIKLQSILDVHLDENMLYDMKKGGSAKTVKISIALSILLMMIGSINFINMSIAQAGTRAKEVGVRKALGSSRQQLLLQFLLESVSVAAISALIACAIVELLLPAFNQFVSRELSISYFSYFGVFIVSSTLVVGFLSGVYPALFISSFSAKRVLSGDMQRGTTAIRIRKFLMVFQAALSIGLIIGAITLYMQLQFLDNLAVGYDKSQRLRVLNTGNIFDPKYQSLFNDISKISGVNDVTPTDFNLTVSTNAGVNIRLPGSDAVTEGIKYAGVGYDAVSTLGLKLIAGRDFSEKHKSDWFNEQTGVPKASILISRSLLIAAGYDSPEQAIDKVFRFDAGPSIGFNGKIVGVVEDVKIGSTRSPQSPIVFVCGLTWAGGVALTINVEDEFQLDTRQRIEDVIKERLKLDTVEVELVSEQYSAIYQGERIQAQVVLLFSGLAVFLTCVGIFGLAAFSAQRRNKEVAIRKVLGASRTELVNLLAKEYLILIGISIVVAFPIAFYFIDSWLTNFNDRISQNPLVYLVAAGLVMFVTWSTVFSLALRMSSIQPFSMLRKE